MDAVYRGLERGWRVVRRIGGGSYGDVYELEKRDELLGESEKAALKVLRLPRDSSAISDMRASGYSDESIAGTLNDCLKDIRREYSMMRSLKDAPNIVKCDNFDYIPHENGLGWDVFIRMELLTPLTECVTLRPTDTQVIKIGKDICSALIACRKNGIVHRDIKPQNILYSAGGNYKLGDFGVAKNMDRTTGGSLAGTFGFMAPEILLSQNYDARVDIYSLGLVLHWLLNEHKPPFINGEVTRAGEEEARKRRFAGEKLPYPLYGSKALGDVILKACQFRSEDRFQSPEEMLRALESIPSRRRDTDEDGTVVGSSDDILREWEQRKRSGGSVPPVDPAPRSGSSAPSRHKSFRTGLIIAAVLAVIAVAWFGSKAAENEKNDSADNTPEPETVELLPPDDTVDAVEPVNEPEPTLEVIEHIPLAVTPYTKSNQARLEEIRLLYKNWADVEYPQSEEASVEHGGAKVYKHEIRQIDIWVADPGHQMGSQGKYLISYFYQDGEPYFIFYTVDQKAADRFYFGGGRCIYWTDPSGTMHENASEYNGLFDDALALYAEAMYGRGVAASYTVQVGSFLEEEDAWALYDQLILDGYLPREEFLFGRYCILCGNYADRAAAMADAEILSAYGRCIVRVS